MPNINDMSVKIEINADRKAIKIIAYKWFHTIQFFLHLIGFYIKCELFAWNVGQTAHKHLKGYNIIQILSCSWHLPFTYKNEFK